MKNEENKMCQSLLNAITSSHDKKETCEIIFESEAELYELYIFLFSKSKTIKIYSKNLGVFSNERKNCLEKELCNKKSTILESFCTAFEKYINHTDVELEILTDLTAGNEGMDLIPEITSLFRTKLDEGIIKVKQMSKDITLINSMDHYILSSDCKIVCFEQKVAQMYICAFNHDNLVSSAKNVFDRFFELSNNYLLESDIND